MGVTAGAGRQGKGPGLPRVGQQGAAATPGGASLTSPLPAVCQGSGLGFKQFHSRNPADRMLTTILGCRDCYQSHFRTEVRPSERSRHPPKVTQQLVLVAGFKPRSAQLQKRPLLSVSHLVKCFLSMVAKSDRTKRLHFHFQAWSWIHAFNPLK